MTDEEQDELLADLAEEFLAQLRTGAALTVDSFMEQHPEAPEALRELLPTMIDVEGLGRQTQPAPPVMAHYPERLGDYHLLERIGSGGMGTVFRARQESLHREVAVKILAPSWNSDPRHSEAFEQESRVIAALRHTNIVEVFGAGQEGNYRYYVMGLVNGKGVSAGRLGAAFPGMPYEKAVAQVGLQAAKALAFAHKNGVVHRDVKPGNLLLDNSGVVQVSDFGLATILNSGEDAPLVTQSHDGTLRYMAPERLLKGINSFAGDQYSLGLTLYELLARRPVFKENEPGRLIQNICDGKLAPLKGFGELGAIINKAVSYAAADRYASMADMAEDLRRYLAGEPVKARSATCWRRYVLWIRRRPAVAVWSHAALLLVGLLFTSVSVGYARVKKALQNENEQRLLAEQNAERADLALLRENEQRSLAEKNEQIADACLQRIFSSMLTPAAEDGTALAPSQADARLLLDLMPYYEQLAAQDDMGSGKVAEASSILATIALKTGDFATAQTYFQRAVQAAQPGGYFHVESTMGLAVAMAAQVQQPDAARHAVKLLADLEQTVPADADFETRLQLVCALQLAAALSRQTSHGRFDSSHRGGAFRLPVRSVGVVEKARADREGLLLRAAKLLVPMLQEQPDNRDVQLRRAELLSYQSEEVRQLLAPKGESAVSLLADILAKSPACAEARLLYVRLADAAKRPGAAPMALDYGLAARYAQSLLADNPADSELILLFLSVRDAYALELLKAGKQQEYTSENEHTLAILSFLTERADFTPEMRERLVMLVASHPQHPAGRTQQESELRTLLQNYDENRIKELRDKMQKMRAHSVGTRRRPGHRGSPRHPHPRAK